MFEGFQDSNSGGRGLTGPTISAPAASAPPPPSRLPPPSALRSTPQRCCGWYPARLEREKTKVVIAEIMEVTVVAGRAAPGELVFHHRNDWKPRLSRGDLGQLLERAHVGRIEIGVRSLRRRTQHRRRPGVVSQHAEQIGTAMDKPGQVVHLRLAEGESRRPRAVPARARQS